MKGDPYLGPFIGPVMEMASMMEVIRLIHREIEVTCDCGTVYRLLGPGHAYHCGCGTWTEWMHFGRLAVSRAASTQQATLSFRSMPVEEVTA